MASNERTYPGHKATNPSQPPRAGNSAVPDLLTGDDYYFQSTQSTMPVPPHESSMGLESAQLQGDLKSGGVSGAGAQAPSPDLLLAEWSQPASLTSRPQASTSDASGGLGQRSLGDNDESEVDGLSTATVDQWFAEADHDGDGRLAGDEAKAFFRRTQLPVQALSKIWNQVKATRPAEGRGLTREQIWNSVKAARPAEGSGLTREQFGVALRLVAFGQSEPHPTPEAMAAAASSAAWRAAKGRPLPAPKLLPDDRPPSAKQDHAAVPSTAAEGARFALSPSTPSSSPFRGAPAGAATSADSQLLLGNSPGSQDSYGLTSNGSAAPLKAYEGQLRTPLPPVALDVRLPPLHPKLAAQLQFMTVGHGSLFAGPTRRGGVLQWGSVEGEVTRPELPPGVLTPQDSWAPAGEDADAGPSTEVFVPDASKASCTFADHLANILWTGHHDGKVSAHSMGDAPGTAANGQLLHCWQAHRVGSVTSLCRTPWGDLWTGTSRGWIRVWEVAEPDAFNDAGEYRLPMREVRRSGGARPHAGGVAHMVCPAGGQVVWSGSERAILLWCAYSGAYLGALISTESELPVDSDQALSAAAEAEDRKHMVDPAKGLEVCSAGRALARPHRLELEQWVEEQVGWAASSEKTSAQYLEAFAFRRGKAIEGAGKAAKFLGKLGRRVARSKHGGGGTADAAPTPLINDAFGGTPGASKSSSSKHLHAGVAGEDDDTPDASLRGGERAENSVAQPSMSQHSMTQQAGERSVGLRCLAASSDGYVFAGFHSGHLKCYTALGRLVWKKDMGVCVRCLAASNRRLWVGLADGRIRVVGLKPGPVAVEEEWLAHEAGVIALAPARSRVVSMAADGSIRAWSFAVGCPQEQLARRRYVEEAADLVERHTFEVAALTWNVNEARPDPQTGVHRWVIDLSKEASLFVVALQEIESGGGSLALAAAKDALLTKQQEKGNANAQLWNAAIQTALGDSWQRLGLRQLSGMLVLVYIRCDLMPYTGEVNTASIACGVLGVGGNKGAVAVSFSLHRRRVAFVCSHFAAHQNMVEARNANYATISRHLCFGKRGAAHAETEANATSKPDKGRNAADALDNGSDSDNEAPPEPKLLRGQGMKEMDMLVWLGDFNYRVDAEYAEAKGLVRRNDLSPLLSKDQLRLEMAAGRTFVHLQEAPITFRPTYKFDKHSVEPLDYDSSEKRRVPAWTDRILFRGSQPLKSSTGDGSVVLGGSLYGRIYSAPAPRAVSGYDGGLVDFTSGGADQLSLEGPPHTPARNLSKGKDQSAAGAAASASEVCVEAKTYSACMDVMQSDHKPVCALLNVMLPHLAPPRARRLASRLLQEVFSAVEPDTPRLSLTPGLLELHQIEQASGRVTLTNEGEQCVSFHVCGSPNSGVADAPIPEWLDVHPTSGDLQPQASVSIQVSAALSENVYSTRAAVAELVVIPSGEFGRGLGRYERQAKDHIGFTVNCKTAGCVALGDL